MPSKRDTPVNVTRDAQTGRVFIPNNGTDALSTAAFLRSVPFSRSTANNVVDTAPLTTIAVNTRRTQVCVINQWEWHGGILVCVR